MPGSAPPGRQTRACTDLDVPLLTRLAPDLILTQDLCRVCSVTDAEVLSACQSADLDPRILSLSPRRLPDVWDSTEAIGKALGEDLRATSLAHELRGRSAPSADALSVRPRVAVLEWVDPPILVGLWGPDIIEAAGGVPVRGQGGEPGTRVDWTDLDRTAPELVVVSPCSFGVPRTRAEIEAAPGVHRALTALQPRLGTWLADEAYFSRPGPRLADGVELLRQLLAGQPPTAPMPVERWMASEAAR